MDGSERLVVLSTAPGLAEAERLASVLVEARLAACVSLVPGVVSVYRWKGAIERGEEVLLVIKTSREVFEPRFTFYGFRFVAVDGFPGELAPANLTGVVLLRLALAAASPARART